jgi:hypothetical protein
MAITLRGTKGSALTHPELDENFTTLVSNDYSTYTTLSGWINTVQSNLTSNNITAVANTFNTYSTVTGNLYTTYNTLSGLIDLVQSNLSSLAITMNRFDYVANANQTVFNGPDINSQSMVFNVNTTQVYMNGLLLRNSNDYVLTASSNTVTLSLGVSADTEITVTSLSLA